MLHYHVDGELVPAEEATVSVADRGFGRPDAAVETARAYGGRVHGWEARLARLERACDALSIPVPGDLRERVRATLSASDLADARVEVVITRGRGPGNEERGHDGGEADPTVVVTVAPLPRGGRTGDPAWEGAALVRTTRWRRPPADSVPPALAATGCPTGTLARLELDAEDEALVRDPAGHVVAPTAGDAVFVDDEGLHVPDPEAVPLVPGVVRETVVDHARDNGIPVTLGRYSPGAFREADEVFLTGPVREIRPVASVDGVAVGGGPVTDLLRTVFANRIEAEFY